MEIKKLHLPISLLAILAFAVPSIAAEVIDGELSPAPDDAFSIVVIPDTQHYHGKDTKSTPDSSEPLTNEVFDTYTRWTAANIERQRIVFASHVGDIVDINNREQWALAQRFMDRLHGKIPYGISVGNHDMTGGGDSSLFQEVFPKSRFESLDWYAGCFENPDGKPSVSGNNANSAQLFEAAGLKFVFLHLECNAPDGVLAWADSVLETYSDRRALITTHMVLGPRDKPVNSEDYFEAPKGRMTWTKRHGDRGNTSQQMWEKCFSKHANVFMICCGDQSRTQALRLESVGEHGNVVHELLSDYGASGLRVMRFLPGQDRIEVRTWDPLNKVLCETTKVVPDRQQHQFVLQYEMSPGVSSADSKGLQAGASAVNIDPPKFPVVQNGGFAMRMANAVAQSLYVRSLVLENGEERVAICIVDTCMMDRELCDRAKALVTKKTGIGVDRILLAATHTHTAPSVMRCLGCPADPDYPDFLVPKIVESIELAAAALQPAEAGWTVADAGKFTNTRRWIYLPHKMRVDPYGKITVRAMMHPGHANPDTAGPSGPEDPDLTLLSIRGRDGKPLAVLGNLSQHYYNRGTLSSGYTGTFCKMLEEEFGTGFVGLLSQGTSGDLQHMDYSRPKKEGIFAGEDDPYQAYCRALSDLAIGALEKVEYRADCKLAMGEAKLTLGRRLPDEERVAWAKPIVEALGDELPRDRPNVLAREVFWLQENPSAEIKLQALRVGDFGIATLPNEVYGITGLKLKLQSPLATLMNIELANGAAGYIPPPEQHHLGGYTTWPARTAGLEVQAEPKIVESLLGLLENVSGGKRRIAKEEFGSHGKKIQALKPVAWWRMGAHSGDRIADASGQGHYAILEPGYALFLDGPQGEGGEFASTARGNRAVHFAGGRMSSAQPALNRGDDYSVSLWFWNSMPHDARKVTGYLFGVGHDGDAKACEQIGISGKALGAAGRLFFYNGNGKRETIIGQSQLTLHHWHHLLLVRGKGKVRIYLDGHREPEIEADITDTRPDEDAKVFVGGRSDGLFNFEGKIDEVAVFDRALVAEENPLLARNRPARPNVLFIGVDDLRPELNCYGATHIMSPNIDRLASEGVLFERAYCQWAVCMPSRASMLSGLRPDSFQGKANAFRQIVPDVVTMPQHFKNHGYFTQAFGKIYHGAWKTAYVGDSFQDPVSWSTERFATGPRYYFSPDGIAKAREVFAASKDRFLSTVEKDPNDSDQWTHYFVRGFPTEAPEVEDHVPQDGQIAGAALKQLRALQEGVAGGEQPFFLAVGFCKPHLPFVAPKKYWDLYDPETLPPVAVDQRPEGSPAFALKTGANEVNQYVRDTRGPVTPGRTKNLRHGYAACVSYIDSLIGQLLDELDVLGLRDDTIVVLWSDHGYKLGDFGSWAKHTNFELDTRVPLIVSAPGRPRGERSEALVELVDLHPTLSELAGLPVHAGAEGESFAASVLDPSSTGQTAAYSQFPKGGYMGYTVRTATHRYTEWRDNRNGGEVAERELYEYGDQGIETVNVADRPEYSEIQNKLQQLLAASRKQ